MSLNYRSPLTHKATVYTPLEQVTTASPSPPQPPSPTRGEGGERGSSNFMENWYHRDLCINRSPQSERGEFLIFPPSPFMGEGG
jgi:hypothetical protein